MKQAMKLSLGAMALGVCVAAYGQAPVVGSLSRNGVLLCTNLVPGTVASVEWAPTVTGPWTNNWAGLDSVTADSNGMVQVSVPMFYRVRGTGAPAGMALIPAGSFTMGDTLDGNIYGDATPISVTVSAFYMDTNLVSYSQWTNVYAYATNHGYDFRHEGWGKAWNHPVQYVDWYDSVKWSNARSAQAGLTPVYYTDAGFAQVYTGGSGTTVYANWAANGYRLPTEAEWEKAARGGLSGKRFPWGDTISESQANYYSHWEGGVPVYFYDVNTYSGYNTNYNTGGTSYTSPVGSFAVNGYGLYDMAGNVWQWCWDWYGTPYGQPTTNNPTGPTGPVIYRVLRGGGWNSDAYLARCANRSSNPYPGGNLNGIGFRCVRGL